MSREPCGGLPYQQVNITVFFCEVHRAWTVWSDHTRFPGRADPVDIVPLRRHDFGPFDGASDVLQHCVTQLGECLLAVHDYEGLTGPGDA